LNAILSATLFSEKQARGLSRQRPQISRYQGEGRKSPA
jgi:hypothetical protein